MSWVLAADFPHVGGLQAIEPPQKELLMPRETRSMAGGGGESPPAEVLGGVCPLRLCCPQLLPHLCFGLTQELVDCV